MATRYGLPEEVKFCEKCVISNQRPSSSVEFKSKSGEHKKVINFTNEGVCSACEYHLQKEMDIDWNEREKKLYELLSEFRRSDGGYDVIVPGSGGKDSAYTAHILKYKYDMNPLTVTWAPHEYTGIGQKNVDKLIPDRNITGDNELIIKDNFKTENKDDIHVNEVTLQEIKKEFQDSINKNSSDINELKKKK